MNKTIDCKVLKNKEIALGTYLISFAGPTEWMSAGKFVDIAIKGKFLRRPMSVCEWDEKSFSCIYKVVGKGTELLSKVKRGEYLNIFLDLGNGYEITKDLKDVLIISGGCGIGSVLPLAKKFKESNIDTVIVAGFKTKKEIFLKRKLKKYSTKCYICTEDGSTKNKGNVVDMMIKYDLVNRYFYACGSTSFLKAVHANSKSQGQLSLEARMGCGYGVCMGCTVDTTEGPKRICVEGPVFKSEVIKW